MTNIVATTAGFDIDSFADALLTAIVSKVNAQPATAPTTVIETAPIVQAPPIDRDLTLALRFRAIVQSANTATLDTHPASFIAELKSFLDDLRSF